MPNRRSINRTNNLLRLHAVLGVDAILVLADDDGRSAIVDIIEEEVGNRREFTVIWDDAK